MESELPESMQAIEQPIIDTQPAEAQPMPQNELQAPLMSEEQTSIQHESVVEEALQDPLPEVAQNEHPIQVEQQPIEVAPEQMVSADPIMQQQMMNMEAPIADHQLSAVEYPIDAQQPAAQQYPVYNDYASMYHPQEMQQQHPIQAPQEMQQPQQHQVQHQIQAPQEMQPQQMQHPEEMQQQQQMEQMGMPQIMEQPEEQQIMEQQAEIISHEQPQPQPIENQLQMVEQTEIQQPHQNETTDIVQNEAPIEMEPVKEAMNVDDVDDVEEEEANNDNHNNNNNNQDMDVPQANLPSVMQKEDEQEEQEPDQAVTDEQVITTTTNTTTVSTEQEQQEPQPAEAMDTEGDTEMVSQPNPESIPEPDIEPEVVPKAKENVMVNRENEKMIKTKPKSSLLPELIECRKLLNEFMRRPETEPFNEPVDWKGLNLPDYPLIITKPMDLGTVLKKLNASKYSSADQFAADMRLVFKNAKTYNTPGSGIFVVAENLHKQFERKFARITKNVSINKKRKSMEKIKNGQESTFKDRQKFTTLIQSLTPPELGGVVELIDKKSPMAINEMGSNDDELEIEVYHIDAVTLKDLITHCQKVISKRSKKKRKTMY